MNALTIGLVIALVAVLAAEFVNGWTDAPNAIATVISTGVMTPRQAVVMAVVMNTVGAMAGTAVATTVAQGIVAPSALTLLITATMVSIVALGIACGAWEFRSGIARCPRSGRAALAGGGWAALQWSGGRRWALAWPAHSVSALGAFVLGRLIIALQPTRRRREPSALSIAPNWRRLRSWPSITGSTTGRSSWAYSR
jgi:PiT family inorganic phosphate transporter